MPFTPSHAVVALPFVRTPLVPAAIAIGATAPDLPLFVRGLPLHYGRTHDFAWLPVTAALALILLVVWRCAFRPAARELSPRWLAARLPEGWDRGAADALRDTFSISAARAPGSRQRWSTSGTGILLLLLSLVIGVASHIVWDLFTHDARWGVAAIPLLAEQWGPLAGFKWLQHGSSVLGLVILAIWAIAWLRRQDAVPPAPRILPVWVRTAWWLSLPVALVVAWSIGLAVHGPLTSTFSVAHLAYRVLPSACAVWGVLTLALCVVVQARRR